MPLADEHARELIHTVLDRNIVVEAAAGTGKTSELVKRMLATLESGRTTIDRVIAVTFTEKAAGELKLRVHTALEQARVQSTGTEKRQRIEHALTHLDEARISTIHALCTDLLRERPVEAQLDPQFEVLTESAGRRLYRQAFRSWFQQCLGKPQEGIRRFLRRRTSKYAADMLMASGRDLLEWRDFKGAWYQQPFDRETQIDLLTTQLHEFAALTHAPLNKNNPFYRTTAAVRALSTNILIMETGHPRDYDGLEAMFVEILNDDEYEELRQPKDGPARFNDEIAQSTLQEKHADWLQSVTHFVAHASSDLAALLHFELGESIAEYQGLKARNGQVDFLDLLIEMRNLLVRSQAVRKHFQERFSHIFVDEFQDTDPIQAEILLLLAADDFSIQDWRYVTPVPGKLFLVADPKQAIYRFRRADLRIYNEVKNLLIGKSAVSLELTTSFRSVPSVQSAINRAFAAEMRADHNGQQAMYVPLSPFREECTSQPALIALSVPKIYGSSSFNKAVVDKCLPDTVAAFVHWLIRESGWTVSKRDNPDERAPITSGDICILSKRLFDRFNGEDIGRRYAQALEARNIPHQLSGGGRSFYAREEVQTILTALTAIEWPDDELSVFATLKGSLFAIRDDQLLRYRNRLGSLHPFRSDSEDSTGECEAIGKALEILRQLHRNRSRLPVAETIETLLREVRTYAAFAVRPSGEQVMANALHLVDLARKYELSGGLSLRGFLEEMEDAADAQETVDAGLFEESSEGVRIMSVHRAKGLEFPVVVLVDIAAKMSIPPRRYIDTSRNLCAIPLANCIPWELQENSEQEAARDREEGVRLAYVAATRARDMLVVPAIGDHPFEWETFNSFWVRPLYSGIYPSLEDYRKSEVTPSCPLFGNDSVLDRTGPRGLSLRNVQPGLHRIASDHNMSYSVVWWDPRNLKLDVPRLFGVRQQELLQEILSDENAETVNQGCGEYHEWRQNRAWIRREAATPRVVVRTATAATRSGDPVLGCDLPVVEMIDLGHNTRNVGGIRFGTLVHEVLGVIALDAMQEQIAEIALVYGRILGATEEEIESATTIIRNVLLHPLLVRAKQASECRRESPLTLRSPDGTILEGVVDLAFCENNIWVVIDFKTDRELEEQIEKYRRQVALYCVAISKATGHESHGFLMKI